MSQTLWLLVFPQEPHSVVLNAIVVQLAVLTDTVGTGKLWGKNECMHARTQVAPA